MIRNYSQVAMYSGVLIMLFASSHPLSYFVPISSSDVSSQDRTTSAGPARAPKVVS